MFNFFLFFKNLFFIYLFVFFFFYFNCIKQFIFYNISSTTLGSPLDIPAVFEVGFQPPATALMEHIINFHHNIFFFLIIISVVVFWLLFRVTYIFPKNFKNSYIFSYITFLFFFIAKYFFILKKFVENLNIITNICILFKKVIYYIPNSIKK